MWTDAEVSGGQRGRGEQRGRESREAPFTHMVLVRRLPLRTVWSGRNFTFHSLRAFLRHFYPPLEGHFQLFYVGVIHTVHLSRREQQGKIGMLTNAEVSSGLHCNAIYSVGNKKKYITISLL